MYYRRITNEYKRFNRTLLNGGNNACCSNGNRKEVTMNEITKMYDNVGIAPKKCSECDNNMDCGFGKDCYIPFTAEKQIELIKWLSKKQYVYIIMSADKEYYLCADNSFISGYNKQFDKALAMFVNAYWQDLTEEEKQQVKGILK